MTLTRLVSVFLSTTASGLVKINPQFTEVKCENILAQHAIFICCCCQISSCCPAASCFSCAWLPCLLVPGVIANVRAAVNHLHTVCSVCKLTSVGLGGYVQFQSGSRHVHREAAKLCWAQLSFPWWLAPDCHQLLWLGTFSSSSRKTVM